MSSGVTMRSSLSAEVPSFHNTLVSFTFTCGNHIDELPWSEMSWTKHVPDWQKVFASYLELSQMILWWESILQEMANLWFLNVLHIWLSNTNLDRVDTVLVFLLDLSYLASIDLYNSTWMSFTPSIPEMSASDLVPK
jgi:hypothetical protein